MVSLDEGVRVSSGGTMIKTLCVAAVLMTMIPQGGTVSGTILDREGKPLVNGQITYTHIGSYSNAPDASGTGGGNLTNSGTGKVFKCKTNKKGEVQMINLAIGVYRVEIRDSSGAFLDSGRTYVGDNADTTWSNVQNLDLSSSKLGDTVVREHNTRVSEINRLTTDLHSALDGRDWSRATDILRQLIVLDPD